MMERPHIDDRFIAPDGETLTVMAVWSDGVVFDQERTATLDELHQYIPVDRCGN